MRTGGWRAAGTGYKQWDIKPNLVSICSWSSHLFTLESRPIINQAVTLSLSLGKGASGSWFHLSGEFFQRYTFPSSLCQLNLMQSAILQMVICTDRQTRIHILLPLGLQQTAALSRALAPKHAELTQTLWYYSTWQIHCSHRHVKAPCHCLLILQELAQTFTVRLLTRWNFERMNHYKSVDHGKRDGEQAESTCFIVLALAVFPTLCAGLSMAVLHTSVQPSCQEKQIGVPDKSKLRLQAHFMG